MRRIYFLVFAAWLAAASLNAQQTAPANNLNIPDGTILPVRLNQSISSKSAAAGRVLTARIMQDVPLPNDEKIPVGAVVRGAILSVTKASASTRADISFRFDTLEMRHRTYPITSDLRAIAGFMEVQFAQTPEVSPGYGTPQPWITTQQIGGDEVYGVGGPVTDRASNHVGTGVYGGVLVHVRAHPERDCRGPVGNDDRLQALWVFSSDACGVYGIEGLSIAHAGRSKPIGEVTLAASQGEVRLHGATAMLLRVNSER